MPIDLDWSSCPHCQIEEPIPRWRMVRPGVVVVAAAVIGVCLIALGAMI